MSQTRRAFLKTSLTAAAMAPIGMSVAKDRSDYGKGEEPACRLVRKRLCS